MKTIKDMDLNNKTVIIRCDFNVPIDNGMVTDDTRIKAALPTINYALERNCKIILLSHLGRIKTEDDKSKYSLKPIQDRLEILLKHEVLFSKATSGPALNSMVSQLKVGEILLVENTRYEDLPSPKESHNDQTLAKNWAALGDVFINDAFGTLHRNCASTVGIATYLPSAVGLLIENELEHLKIVDKPVHPYVVLLGGAKVVDKIGVIEELIKKADHILIGGGMAFTFLKAKGYEVGLSLVDDEHLSFCTQLLKEYPDKIVLPVDVIVNTSMKNATGAREITIDQFTEKEQGFDIGSETILQFSHILQDAKTVVWNGPVGCFEQPPYDQGTRKILEKLEDIPAKIILGGGDTVAAAKKFGYNNKNSHLSTGGGATLCYLEGKDLPGLVAIMKEEK